MHLAVNVMCPSVSIPIWCDYKIGWEPDQLTYTVFQFQYGAIIRWMVVWLHKINDVSIPIWCDYKVESANFGNQTKMFQFQYGAIISKYPK